jgi:murein DD-endopeptidase MepM/ murein hydrolase activator NlpD
MTIPSFIRHDKPTSGGSCDNRGCYYSTYLHVSSSTVAVDQSVNQGDLIGYTGQSDAGFEHLHFEIRDGGLNQRDCVHPLAVLPFTDASAPPVTLMSVDLSQLPDTLVVDASVTLPPAELDLNRVEVHVFDTSGGQIIPTDTFSYDFNEWNRLYSSPPGEPDTFLNDPTFGGVVVTPSPFKAGTPQYRINFSFERLAASADPAFLLLRVRAIDVAGHATEAYFP